MKIKILSGLLVLSLVFNIAGVVFLVAFLKTRSTCKALKREQQRIVANLSLIRGAGVAPEPGSGDHVLKRTFRSHVDGKLDSLGLIPPRTPDHTDSHTLVVYFHGMGSNFMEPFVVPYDRSVADAITAGNARLALLSVNYRGEASWGSDAAYADVSQNIRQVMEEFPVDRIVLIGTSMGGCAALTYAAVAPPAIRGKISGVVSVEAAGDLTDLYRESSHPAVRQAMRLAFAATPDTNPHIYRQKSLSGNLDSFPRQARVAVVSATKDTIVPPELQEQIISMLASRGIACKLIKVDEPHGAPPASCYRNGLKFVLCES